ncbi:MAG: hypothetical protein HQL63_08180 [Magnetococcales bacterium]|nr:hypothetical protein [Magnetococcales bacterium]
MAGFFKKIFGSHASEHGRALRHPRDLRKGDGLRFGTLDTLILSGERFTVDEVNTYLFGNERSPELTLTSAGGLTVHLTLDEREDPPLFWVSGRLERSDVARLFRLEEFAKLFDDKDGPLTLHRMEEPDSMAGWTASVYLLKVDAAKGIFHKGDYRGNAFFPRPQDGKGLDYYLLADDDAIHMIEVEVYDGGETEVYVGHRFDLSRIEEMWPGSGA